MFTIDTKVLSAVLAAAGKFVSTKNTLPALNNVLLATEGQSLVVAATNLETTFVQKVPVEAKGAVGITLPAKTLTEMVASLTGPVTISVKGVKASIKATGFNAEMTGILAEEFPALPQLDDATRQAGIVLPCKALKQGIAQIAPAAADDTARPEMNGINLVAKGGTDFQMAATDGFRLAVKKFELASPRDAGSWIVPHAAIQTMGGLLPDTGDVTIAFIGSTAVMFEVESAGLRVTIQQISGNYPNWEAIVAGSKSVKVSLSVPAGQLVTALKSVMVIAREGTNPTVVIRKAEEANRISLSAMVDQVGASVSQVDVTQAEGSVFDFPIGLNPSYFRDALSAFAKDDTLLLGMRGEKAPFIIKSRNDDKFFTLVVPLIIGR